MIWCDGGAAVVFGLIDAGTLAEKATAQTNRGGQVTLPPRGFVVEGPSLVAFYAKHWGGQTYADGALFTIRPVQAESFAQAKQVKIFHGFGDPTIVWRDKTHTVRREKTVDSR